MSDYMERIKEFINGKKVLILGFGREGRSTFDLFAKAGTAAKISIADANTALTLPEGFSQTVVHTGANYQNHIFNYDIIMKSPGIVLEPQVLTEVDRITSQAELFLKWYGKQTIGITGTKGKSTTTTLLYHILKENGKKTILAGNIGIPAFDILDQIEDDSLIVCELSCHQLEYTKYSPHIAIFLNLYEEHLDHYGSFEKYKEAKMNIFKYQDKDDILYIGDEVEALAKGANSSVNVCCYTEDSKEYAEHTSLLGKHNFFDISLVAKVCAGLGVDKASFIRALKTYKPLPHRLEYFATVNGVKYYDDSISTISETTIQALETLTDTDCVLIGGMDRGIDYSPLESYFSEHPAVNVVLMYETGARIAREMELKYGVKINTEGLFLVPDLKEAVALCGRIAKKGKSVVLSPAAASYGYFRNFEDRGEVFKTLVNNLK